MSEVKKEGPIQRSEAFVSSLRIFGGTVQSYDERIRVDKEGIQELKDELARGVPPEEEQDFREECEKLRSRWLD